MFQRAPIRERQTTALNRSPNQCHPPIATSPDPRWCHPPDCGLPKSVTKSANSPARSCSIESAKNTAVFQRAPIRERQTTALNHSPNGATPRLRPVDGLADASIGVDSYVRHRLFGTWFDSREPRWCHPPIADFPRSEMVPPAGLWPSQVGDQERQLTGAELPDRISENPGSFSKGANQRAPDNRAEPLPKTVPPCDPRRCHPPIAAG